MAVFGQKLRQRRDVRCLTGEREVGARRERVFHYLRFRDCFVISLLYYKASLLLARVEIFSCSDKILVNSHREDRPMRSETLRRQHPRSTVFSTTTKTLFSNHFGFDFYYNSVLTKKNKPKKKPIACLIVFSVFSRNCLHLFRPESYCSILLRFLRAELKTVFQIPLLFLGKKKYSLH